MTAYLYEPMNSITITLPYPDRRLNAHSKTNRWQVREAAKVQRAAAKALALQALNGRPAPQWPRVSMVLDVWYPRNSGQDVLNTAQMVKPGIDGIVDAGIMVDDKHTVIPAPRPQFRGYDKKNARIEITVTQETEDED